MISPLMIMLYLMYTNCNNGFILARTPLKDWGNLISSLDLIYISNSHPKLSYYGPRLAVLTKSLLSRHQSHLDDALSSAPMKATAIIPHEIPAEPDSLKVAYPLLE